MPRKRGGYQAPSHPAPASGPGKLAQRTDGGPGDHQPIRPAPGGSGGQGGNYGDRKASIEQQQAAPLRAGGTQHVQPAPTDPASGQADPSGAPAVPNTIDVWGPTNRPSEPVTAGARLGPGPGPQELSTAEKLKLIYRLNPDPDLLDIILAAEQG